MESRSQPGRSGQISELNQTTRAGLEQGLFSGDRSSNTKTSGWADFKFMRTKKKKNNEHHVVSEPWLFRPHLRTPKITFAHSVSYLGGVFLGAPPQISGFPLWFPSATWRSGLNAPTDRFERTDSVRLPPWEPVAKSRPAGRPILASSDLVRSFGFFQATLGFADGVGRMDPTVDGRNPFRTTLKPWLKPMFVGKLRGIIIPGFSRCRISSIHRMNVNSSYTRGCNFHLTKHGDRVPNTMADANGKEETPLIQGFLLFRLVAPPGSNKGMVESRNIAERDRKKRGKRHIAGTNCTASDAVR